jgi:hypothetical protein
MLAGRREKQKTAAGILLYLPAPAFEAFGECLEIVCESYGATKSQEHYRDDVNKTPIDQRLGHNPDSPRLMLLVQRTRLGRRGGSI